MCRQHGGFSPGAAQAQAPECFFSISTPTGGGPKPTDGNGLINWRNWRRRGLKTTRALISRRPFVRNAGLGPVLPNGRPHGLLGAGYRGIPGGWMTISRPEGIRATHNRMSSGPPRKPLPYTACVHRHPFAPSPTVGNRRCDNSRGGPPIHHHGASDMSSAAPHDRAAAGPWTLFAPIVTLPDQNITLGQIRVRKVAIQKTTSAKHR